MNKEFIPYEQALELRELGYLNEYTTCRCVEGITEEDEIWGWGVLYQRAFRWFREKHNLHQHIEYIGASNEYQWHINHRWDTFKTYEEAELACLKKLIEIVKK